MLTEPFLRTESARREQRARMGSALRLVYRKT
jgi:hypothetical protein